VFDQPIYFPSLRATWPIIRAVVVLPLVPVNCGVGQVYEFAEIERELGRRPREVQVGSVEQAHFDQ